VDRDQSRDECRHGDDGRAREGAPRHSGWGQGEAHQLAFLGRLRGELSGSGASVRPAPLCAATGGASPQGRLSASGEPVGPPLPPVGCVRLRRPALAGLGVRRPSDAVARPEARLPDR